MLNRIILMLRIHAPRSMWGLQGILCFMLLSFTGCATYQPAQTENVCRIFKESPRWYWSTQASERQWHVPIAVQMAIMHQESRFQPKAKPPRRKLLGFIPWKRPSSAYGYTQALTGTWEEYQRNTHSNGAKRDNFKAATDFIGWYANKAQQKANISPSDARALYLAYHEGIGGYQRQTYANKQWLMNVAHKVDRRARTYDQQLNICQASLPKKHWWNIG